MWTTVPTSPAFKSLFEKSPGGCCFVEKVGWRDATMENISVGLRSRSTEARRPFPRNPRAAGLFVRGLRWLVRHSPLRGCSGSRLWPQPKSLCRAPCNFQKGSKALMANRPSTPHNHVYSPSSVVQRIASEKRLGKWTSFCDLCNLLWLIRIGKYGGQRWNASLPFCVKEAHLALLLRPAPAILASSKAFSSVFNSAI